MNRPRLLVAGGGTGGHLFPAMAVAEAWQQRHDGEVLFVGTAQGLEARVLPAQGQPLALLRVGRLKGSGWWARLTTLLGLPTALWQAIQVVRTFQPAVVLGVGGYASAPAVAAAWLLRVPVAIHEQNARPGLTNRWLGRLARRIFVSFPDTGGVFDPRRVVCTGNPVRQNLVEAQLPVPPADEVLRLLVFGGSLGATVFSQVVPEAVARLAHEGIRLQVTQQARQEDLASLQEAYQAVRVTATVTPFIQDMGRAYGEADLVICRAGATSVAELAVLGKASLLVPYPHAADDHQTANALALLSTGGAWMIPQGAFTADWLTVFLQERYHQRGQLAAIGSKARQLARTAAAADMADQLRQLAARE